MPTGQLLPSEGVYGNLAYQECIFNISGIVSLALWGGVIGV